MLVSVGRCWGLWGTLGLLTGGIVLAYLVMMSASSMSAFWRCGCNWITGVSWSAVTILRAALVIMSFAVIVGTVYLVGKNSTVSVIHSECVFGT